MNPFAHEIEFRGAELIQKLGTLRVTLCGAGALGSNLADSLARQGANNLCIIDRDKVEESNIGTQLYLPSEVGAWKAEVLRNRLFRTTGIEVEAIKKELTSANAAKLLGESELILDLFDNSASRSLVQQTARERGIPCLHVGLTADYAEVIWDADYRVPQDAPGDVCDYPLARNLVLFAVVVAAETILNSLRDGTQVNRTLTLRDLAVREWKLGSSRC
jgi:molybdopterin/thiamine biosynthesis adenylyltransferase